MTISNSAAGARENARRANGEFGTQLRDEADDVLNRDRAISDRVDITKAFYRESARFLDQYACDKDNPDVDQNQLNYQHGRAIAAAEAYVMISVPDAAGIAEPGAIGRRHLKDLLSQGTDGRPDPNWDENAEKIVDRSSGPLSDEDARKVADDMIRLAIKFVPREADIDWEGLGVYNSACGFAAAIEDVSNYDIADREETLNRAICEIVSNAEPGTRTETLIGRVRAYDTELHHCDACEDTGLVDWEPGAHRNSDEDQQPCPDC